MEDGKALKFGTTSGSPYNTSQKVGMEGQKNHQMPPASVMTRLILIMVWRKLIRNPNTYSSLLGLIWSLVSYRFIFLTLSLTHTHSHTNVHSKWMFFYPIIISTLVISCYLSILLNKLLKFNCGQMGYQNAYHREWIHIFIIRCRSRNGHVQSRYFNNKIIKIEDKMFNHSDY